MRIGLTGDHIPAGSSWGSLTELAVPSRRELVRTWVATASRWAGLRDRGLASSYLAGVRLASISAPGRSPTRTTPTTLTSSS